MTVAYRANTNLASRFFVFIAYRQVLWLNTAISSPHELLLSGPHVHHQWVGRRVDWWGCGGVRHLKTTKCTRNVALSYPHSKLYKLKLNRFSSLRLYTSIRWRLLTWYQFMTTSSTTYSAVWSTVLQGRVVDHCEFRIHSHVAFQVAFAAVVDKRAIAPPNISDWSMGKCDYMRLG